MNDCKKLTKGFREFMSPERHRWTKYGINVRSFCEATKTIAVTFTFLSGQRYCCSSSGCHHGLLFDSDYQRLRTFCEAADAKLPYPITIHMTVVYEGGALFAVNPGDKHPDYEPVRASSHEEVYAEAEAYR
jgi:hypothetical protein